MRVEPNRKGHVMKDALKVITALMVIAAGVGVVVNWHPHRPQDWIDFAAVGVACLCLFMSLFVTRVV